MATSGHVSIRGFYIEARSAAGRRVLLGSWKPETADTKATCVRNVRTGIYLIPLNIRYCTSDVTVLYQGRRIYVHKIHVFVCISLGKL